MSVIAPDTVPAPTGSALPAGLPACALVDLDAVSANVAALRRIAPGAALMAVVKADGYGHGMVPVARAALAGGADQLGPAHPSVRAQREAFDAAVAEVERAGLSVPLRHLANSAATVLDERARYDLVRPGISVYGFSPAPHRVGAAELGLRPAMTLLARVA